ncbi:hypothetical protein M011DRAFT_219644 [Sporormia fimetaria CBS 119925]|uniref:Uncharacterized protein n=1 Tax=Sporormia fimetaria CBS 119925 TaxID=1340428 RepID=A0A6A6UZI0_9PLEO|nr:hypothetical protein M011DRAFT_219644 [Sporormia fimetaria CBS 119925]
MPGSMTSCEVKGVRSDMMQDYRFCFTITHIVTIYQSSNAPRSRKKTQRKPLHTPSQRRPAEAAETMNRQRNNPLPITTPPHTPQSTHNRHHPTAL